MIVTALENEMDFLCSSRRDMGSPAKGYQKQTLEGIKMAIYTIKTTNAKEAFMAIVKEIEDGYVVRIVRDQDGYSKVTTDFISRALFDSCVRTGYITKINEPEQKMAANA